VNKGQFADLTIQLNWPSLRRTANRRTWRIFVGSLKQKLPDPFSEQQPFSRTRNIDAASVRLRFSIMTEVKAGANILNPNQYPQIGDNTLNCAVPCHSNIGQNPQNNKGESRVAVGVRVLYGCGYLCESPSEIKGVPFHPHP